MDSDTTFPVKLDRLKEASIYQYALYSVGEKRIVLGQDRDHAFRTPSSKKDDFSFAFYSCHMPFKYNKLRKNTKKLNMDMWESLYATLLNQRNAKQNMDFVIAGGDQVYADVVDSLDIWRRLKKEIRKGNDNLLPNFETMICWYRDIYRRYWGFDKVRQVFSSFPTYMIWDDHELGDGWGSYRRATDGKGKDDLNRILGAYQAKKFTRKQGWDLVDRMGKAAKQVYREYQHSHNLMPKDEEGNKEGQYDYSFPHRQCAKFYVLDGRGHRDINEKSYKVLGRKQMDRFRRYVDGLDAEQTQFLFVVSAVSVQHIRSWVFKCMLRPVTSMIHMRDDLRDAWEWNGHQEEKEELLEILFGAAEQGIKVCILSGNIHVSAVFSITDSKNNKIYQLSSSAITHNISKFRACVLEAIMANQGKTKEGYRFERLKFYNKPTYAVIEVRPREDTVVFHLCGREAAEKSDQQTDIHRASPGDRKQPISHSVDGVKLTW